MLTMLTISQKVADLLFNQGILFRFARGKRGAPFLI
jgi:hypothetical protein